MAFRDHVLKSMREVYGSVRPGIVKLVEGVEEMLDGGC